MPRRADPAAPVPAELVPPDGEPAPAAAPLGDGDVARTSDDVIDEVVAAWHADHFHGLGLLLSAEISNRIGSARDDLATRLKRAIRPVPHGEA